MRRHRSSLSAQTSFRRGARGFTLIEVMTAVVILAMALAAIIAGFANQANLSAELRDRTLAMMVARNRLAEFTLAEHFPDTGRSDGTRVFADNDWSWNSEVSDTEDPALRRIDIRVRREGDERALATISGFVAETGRQR